MKVKQSQATPSSLRIVQDFFKGRKFLIRGMLGMGGLAVLVLLFLGVLGYGAYLAKVGELSYSKPALLKIAELNFSFLKNYVNGRLTKFDKVRLEINPKGLARIQNLWEKAIEEGIMNEPNEDEGFLAKLTYNDKTYDVRINLTNTMAMHLKDPSKWSFQIKTNEGDLIKDMKCFDLLLPSTGAYLTHWMGSELMKDRRISTLKGDFVKFAVNGKSRGVFYLQERFDKELFESDRFREGILFNLEEDLFIYEEDKLMQHPAAKTRIASLRRMWREVKAGNLSPHALFDLEKMGGLFAIFDLMDHNHPLLPENLCFYYNPFSQLAEPVALKFENLNTSNPFKFSSLLEKPGVDEKWLPGYPRDSMIGVLLDNLELKRFYIREGEVLCQDWFIDQFLIRKGDTLTKLLNGASPSSTAQDLEQQIQLLYGNAKHLRYVLFPGEAEIIAWFNQKEGDHLSIRLRNQQDLPVEVSHLSWRDSILFYPDEPVILDSRARVAQEQPQLFSFRIPPAFPWADSLLPELKLYYSLLGMQTGKRTILVFPWVYEDRQDHARNPAARKANYTAFSFIEKRGNGNILVIPAGKWTITRDLILPQNKRFQIEAGAQIDLLDHAKIISYSPVFCLGEEENPVVITSSDTTGEGLIVIRAHQPSHMQYTTMDRLSCPKDDGWQLPGAVTFYESPVHLTSCTFSYNRRGDDFLNIIRSGFSMDQVTFKNIFADAFDCDFCSGTVTNSSFSHIGNDGIDVSGTTLEVSHIFMEYIGDKGLSAGENSDLTGKWVEIRNAEIGVTSKDRSSIILSDAHLINARIGITLFQKKTEFGPAYLTGERVDIRHSEIPYLIEENSELIMDGNTVPANRKNIKDILYGVEYGKSSK